MGRTLIHDVRKTARKRGYLAIGITGCEKWNHPSENNNWGKLENIRADGRIDGTYDIEGHTWTDINMQVSLNPFVLDDLKVWFKDFVSWIEGVIELWNDCVSIKRRQFNLDLWFSYIFETIETLGLTKTYWASTVQSFEVAKSDLAGELADKLLESTRPPYDEDWLDNINDPKYNPEYRVYLDKMISTEQEIHEQLTYGEVLEYVLKICKPIGNGLYILKEDPTIVYVDNSVRSYDMKDGYSDRAIGGFIEEWSQKFLKIKVPVLDIRNKGQKNGIWRRVKASILTFSAERRENKDGSEI